MKKMLLTVSSPCHESWDRMTPVEKGRFCAACQKTVVDFTAMSDHQLASFFKKEKGSVCGRFYDDQLNGPIEVYDKQFSLPKHFFRYTWPALLLFLKACDHPGKETVGIMGVVLESPIAGKPPVVGNLDVQETKGDTTFTTIDTMVTESCVSSTCFLPPVIKGETEVKVSGKRTELADQRIDSPFAIIDTTRISLDAVRIETFKSNEAVMTMGVIAVQQPAEVPPKEPKQMNKPVNEENIAVNATLYPNPVAKGQPLTVFFKEGYKGVYHIYGSSRQIIQTGKVAVAGGQGLNIRLNIVAAGTYFILFVDSSSLRRTTQKFMVQ